VSLTEAGVGISWWAYETGFLRRRDRSGCICAYAREADDDGISALDWGYGMAILACYYTCGHSDTGIKRV
jgi:hypothetical protein